MEEILAVVVIASPITLGVVQGLKAGGVTSSRWAMPSAIFVGVIVCLLIGFADVIDGYTEADWAVGVLAGVLSGLAASGTYSGVKAVAGSA